LVDRVLPERRMFGIENVRDVERRMITLIRNLEIGFCGETFLFVSHGDPINILKATFDGVSVTRHRAREPIKTGAIIRLGGATIKK